MADNIPAWLTAACDQRIALLDDTSLPQSLQGKPGQTAIVMALAEPAEGATPEDMQRWERSCDHCGKDCRGTDFYTGHIETAKGTVTVLITFGVCTDCKF